MHLIRGSRQQAGRAHKAKHVKIDSFSVSLGASAQLPGEILGSPGKTVHPAVACHISKTKHRLRQFGPDQHQGSCARLHIILLLNRADQLVDCIHTGPTAHFGKHQPIRTRRSNRFSIISSPRRILRIDTNQTFFRAKVCLFNPVANRSSGCFLVLRRDRIFQIKNQGIRIQRQSLLEHSCITARHKMQ